MEGAPQPRGRNLITEIREVSIDKQQFLAIVFERGEKSRILLCEFSKTTGWWNRIYVLPRPEE